MPPVPSLHSARARSDTHFSSGRNDDSVYRSGSGFPKGGVKGCASSPLALRTVLRNRLHISVTHHTGARHFSVPRSVGRIALLSAVVVIGAMFLATLTIVTMQKKLDVIEGKLARTVSRHEQLLAENAALQASISDKSEALDTVNARLSSMRQELALVDGELGDIEVMIGLRPDPRADMLKRLDTASQSAFEKSMMLSVIPSGHPVENQGITSSFGLRKHPVSGKRKHHGGVDLRAPKGTAVYAPADGIVEQAGLDKQTGFGNLLVITHHLGFRTYYGHLDVIEVKPGDFVEKGQLVARTGKTGRASGPHLHYEIRYLRNRLDPAPFMAWGLETYDTLFVEEVRVPWDSLAKAMKKRAASSEPRLSLREPNSMAN